MDRFVAALPIRHPAADVPGPLDLADLAGAPWVWLHRHISPAHHDVMSTMCRTARVQSRSGPLARSVTSQIAMVECGLGVSVVPSTAVRFRPLRRGTATIGLTAMHKSRPGGTRRAPRRHRHTTDHGSDPRMTAESHSS